MDEIKHDISFIRSHRLQPTWYKVLKVFILLGFIFGYYSLFDFMKALVFTVSFFALALLIHMIYRVMTKRWTQTWLDFKVAEVEGRVQAIGIGKFYYMGVTLSALLSVIISQLAG